MGAYIKHELFVQEELRSISENVTWGIPKIILENKIDNLSKIILYISAMILYEYILYNTTPVEVFDTIGESWLSLKPKKLKITT